MKPICLRGNGKEDGVIREHELPGMGIPTIKCEGMGIRDVLSRRPLSYDLLIKILRSAHLLSPSCLVIDRFARRR